ncbi:MAG TPA: type II secretion system F family protein, partial [Gammaproteobacteria bacterium]|nr:type II secretion system F family protein [Gammaproteobacteria bacterium]
LGTQQPDLDDLTLFCRQMYTLTRAGVPLIRAVTGLSETSRNTVLADTLKEVRAELESGRELSGAMGRFPDVFTPIMVSMVHVGENTGQLDEAFQRLAEHLEMEKDTRDRIKAAVRYPAFVIFAMAVAITVINIWVIPAFANVFEGMGEELPWQTRLLIGTSEFTVEYWPVLVGGFAALVFGLRYYVRTDEGRYQWDRLKLRLPLVGNLIQRATLGRFSRSFAMTLRSGVPLIQALTVTAGAVGNTFVGERVLGMRNGIERGDSLTRTAAASNLFTPLVLQMMAVGEETGAVDDMLDEVGGFYEREVDYDLKNLSSAIEPILIVGVGILVLILALGVFLPMWDMTKMAQ